MEKTCTKCGERKPLAEFHRQLDGRRSQCRQCACAYSSEYREANPETVSEAVRRWAEANPEAKREAFLRWKAGLRARVFGHYGSSCVCCGTTENLSIDHIGGGGGAHRIALFGRDSASVDFYLWLVDNDFPPGYQTLCLPCNTSKGEGERCHIWHAADTLRWIADPAYRK